MAATMYAQEHPRGIYIPRQDASDGSGGGDSLTALYPRFIRQLNIAACPNTKNVVRKPRHLEDNATGRDTIGNAASPDGGHSYEMRTWMWQGYTFNNKKIQPDVRWDPAANAYVKHSPIKSTKNVGRPADVCLLMDADDAPDVENWPDRRNNHGVEGVNVGYCDGHGSFVKTGRPLLMAFLTGYYYPSLSDRGIYAKYGVKFDDSKDEFTW